MKKFSTRTKGFTLIESLVAIFILTAAVVAPLQIAYQGIAATTFAKNKLTAQYLAQDAAEYLLAREIEDPQGWLTTFSNCQTSSDSDNHGCAIDTHDFDDTNGSEAVTCSTGASYACPNMKYTSSDGQYIQTGVGTATSFNRKIQLLPLVHNNGIVEVKATITVNWSSSLNTNKVFVLRTNYFKK